MEKNYIFHGGARERDGNVTKPSGIAHNSAFYHAAKNVALDYKAANVKLIKITTAEKMINEINTNTVGSVESLDIIFHGTPYSLNFSVKENENCGLVTNWFTKQAISAYYSSWDGGIYTFAGGFRYVSDIDFSVFANGARIQIHGCNTARGSMPGDTLVELFSKELFKAGKKLSYVIGHTDKSNPNINGANTTIRQQDYRHGERSIYHDGKLLKKITEKGVINHSNVQALLSGKK